MKYLWAVIGRVFYWLAWPGSWLLLRGSRRTRIVLLDRGRILLVQNWFGDGIWTLPGGGLHKGEDPVAGVIRETHEETGIRLTAAEVANLGSEPLRVNGASFSCHYFTAALRRPAGLRLQPVEILKADWVEREAMAGMKLGPDVARALKLLDSQGPL